MAAGQRPTTIRNHAENKVASRTRYQEPYEYCNTKNDFRRSDEAAKRRLGRDAIRRAGLPRGQEAVALAIFNHWCHHKAKQQAIHPGREHLAKKARVSVRTVASVLAEFRRAGILEPVAYERGGRQPTRYRFSLAALFEFCGIELPADIARFGHAETVQNCTVYDPENRPENRAKIAHGNIGIIKTYPSSDVSGDGCASPDADHPAANVLPFPIQRMRGSGDETISDRSLGSGGIGSRDGGCNG